MNKRGLGRGLDALITPLGDTDVELVNEIAVHDIIANKYQPRRVFDEEALRELAESIRLHGVLQPIIVRKLSVGYELVAGERRWRAAQIAGFSMIPAIVKEYTDGEMTEIALIENIQRENLNSIEEAAAYKQLMEEFGLTQEEVAKRVGRSRSMIANILRLLNLAAVIQEYVSRGTLSMGQAKPILALENEELQIAAAEEIIDQGLSAREAEELVRKMLRVPAQPKITEKPEKKELFLVDVEEKLKMLFGTQVRIKPGKNKSKIEIEYYSEDDLERIIDLLAEDKLPDQPTRGTFVV